jgi:hypothetical protein
MKISLASICLLLGTFPIRLGALSYQEGCTGCDQQIYNYTYSYNGTCEGYNGSCYETDTEYVCDCGYVFDDTEWTCDCGYVYEFDAIACVYEVDDGSFGYCGYNNTYCSGGCL